MPEEGEVRNFLRNTLRILADRENIIALAMMSRLTAIDLQHQLVGQQCRPVHYTEPTSFPDSLLCSTQLEVNWILSEELCKTTSSGPIFTDINSVRHIKRSVVVDLRLAQKEVGSRKTAKPNQHESLQRKLKHEASCAMSWPRLTNMSGH
ncbi:hypothetical protein D9C73_025204 [Collichthys lucidus]|uniref:Uncharacterized protein n=1 Tax=Collichthys lucidus TaxID=240159 RepID=A0A4U5VSV4_COLLU|nr:hypothetical protein D9C73_025204 [Collichthys lucidus]